MFPGNICDSQLALSKAKVPRTRACFGHPHLLDRFAKGGFEVPYLENDRHRQLYVQA